MVIDAVILAVVPLGGELVHVVGGQHGILVPAQRVLLGLKLSLKAGEPAGCCIAVASGVVLGES